MFHVCFLYIPSFTICFELCPLLSSVFYMKKKQTNKNFYYVEKRQTQSMLCLGLLNHTENFSMPKRFVLVRYETGMKQFG